MSTRTNQVSRFANYLNQFQNGQGMIDIYTGLLGMVRAVKDATPTEELDIVKMIDFPTYMNISTLASQLGYNLTDDVATTKNFGVGSAFTDAFTEAIITVDSVPSPSLADKVNTAAEIQAMIANLCDKIVFTR